MRLTVIGAERVNALAARTAADAIVDALRDGVDPAREPARSIVEIPAGHLLLMPSSGKRFVGVKVVGVAPGNPERGRPRIQGSYLLLDSATLEPVAVLDGASLTVRRTAAVSAAAARFLAGPDPRRLVLFGTGPQADGHIAALAAEHHFDDLVVIGRSADRVSRLVTAWSHRFRTCRAGVPSDVETADIVVCATTASTPLFSGDIVPAAALVIAIGSHEPTAAELEPALLARSQVVVEDTATALREAGDVVGAVATAGLDPAALVPFADVVSGRQGVERHRPRVFKSVGMGWQDLAVAVAVYQDRVI